MQAAGFAGTRPLLKASDPRSVTVNRRVEIVVLADLPDDTASLLPSAAKTVGSKTTTSTTSSTAESSTSHSTGTTPQTATTTKASASASATTPSHSTATD
jgi:chemotaxis protein MotB